MCKMRCLPLSVGNFPLSYGSISLRCRILTTVFLLSPKLVQSSLIVDPLPLAWHIRIFINSILVYLVNFENFGPDILGFWKAGVERFEVTEWSNRAERGWRVVAEIFLLQLFEVDCRVCSCWPEVPEETCSNRFQMVTQRIWGTLRICRLCGMPVSLGDNLEVLLKLKNNKIFLVLIAKGSGSNILDALVMFEIFLGFIYFSMRSGDPSWWAELYRNAEFLIRRD